MAKQVPTNFVTFLVLLILIILHHLREERPLFRGQRLWHVDRGLGAHGLNATQTGRAEEEDFKVEWWAEDYLQKSVQL